MNAIHDNAPALGASRFSPLQWQVFLTCGALIMIEGFDLQIVAFVARTVAQAWSLNHAQVTALFTAGVGGSVAGGLLGFLGDRCGRRQVILISMGCFGVLTLLSGLARDATQLVGLRLLTGISLGISMPNVFALCAEFSPATRRSTVVTAVFCALPLGGSLGGLLSAKLLETYGWQACFIACGALPLLFFPAVAKLLPASSASRPAQGLIASNNTVEDGRGSAAEVHGSSGRSVPYSALFSGRFLLGAVCIPLMSLLGLLVLYFLLNWLPWILNSAGLDRSRAIFGVVVLNFGGIVGSLMIGRLMDRTNPYFTLAIAFLVGSLAAIGVPAVIHERAVLPAIFLIGAGLVGATAGLNALASVYFPPRVRGASLGLNYVGAHVGSLGGPALGGFLLANVPNTAAVFLFGSLPAVVAIALALLMQVHEARIWPPAAS